MWTLLTALAGGSTSQSASIRRPAACRRRLDRLPVLRRLEWAEDAELHRGVVTGQAVPLSTSFKCRTSGVQALLKRIATCSALRSLGIGEVEMRITKRFGWFVVVGLLLAVAAAS